MDATVLAHDSDNLRLLLVDRPASGLPAVRSADLDRAWDAAQATSCKDAPLRLAIRFAARDEETMELSLDDPSACAWAGRVDQGFGLRSLYGVALLLRLLALVDLAARTVWLAERWRAGRMIRPDATALAVAARIPLTPDARFDEVMFRDALNRRGVAA